MCLHKVWSHVIIELSLWSLISVQKFSSPSSWDWKKRDASESSLHSGNFSLGWWIVLNHLNFQSTFQFLFSWQIWFKILSQIFVYIFASLAYVFRSLIKLIKLTLWISKEHNNFNCLCKFEADIPNNFGEINFEKLETLQRMYGLIFVLQPSNFEVSTWYSPCCCLQKAEDCPTTFDFHLCIQWRLLWVKKCKQWCQRRLAYCYKFLIALIKWFTCIFCIV